MKSGSARPYEALWQGIWEIERELDLFQQKIGPVYYWPLFRGPVAQRLAVSMGLHEPPGKSVEQWRMRRGRAALARSFKPAARYENIDSILVPFARKPERGRLDLYSARLLTEPEFGRFLVLDNDDRAIVSSAIVPPIVRNWDIERLRARALAVFSFARLFPEARKQSALVQAAVRKHFGLDSGLSAMFMAHRCAAFENGLAASRDVLRQSGARQLFITGRNSAPELLAAASEASIPSIELQHGVIAKFGPHYHYPGRPHVSYTPDWLLTFGPMWQKEVDLPAQTRAVVIGSPSFRQRQHYMHAKCLLVLSQWAIGPKLADAVRTLAKAAVDWRILFRPHPLEDSAAYARAFSYCPNVRVSRDEPLGDQFSNASVQLGVYSTALYEGMAYGLRTILLDLPGIEHMRTCLQRGDAVLVCDATEAAEQLDIAPLARDAAFYISPPFSVAAALNFEVAE